MRNLGLTKIQNTFFVKLGHVTCREKPSFILYYKMTLHKTSRSILLGIHQWLLPEITLTTSERGKVILITYHRQSNNPTAFCSFIFFATQEPFFLSPFICIRKTRWPAGWRFFENASVLTTEEVGAAPQALLRPSSVGRVVLNGARRHCQGI